MAVYTVRLASERVNYLLFGPAQIYHPVYLLFYCMAVGNQDKAYKLEIAYERRNAVLSVNKNTMMDIPFDGNNTDDYVIFLTETL